MAIVEDHPYFSHPGKKVLKAVYDPSLDPVAKYPEETIIRFLLEKDIYDHPVSFSYVSLKGHIQDRYNLTLHKLEIEKFILDPLVNRNVIIPEKKKKIRVYHTDYSRVVNNTHTPKIDRYRDECQCMGSIRWMRLI